MKKPFIALLLLLTAGCATMLDFTDFDRGDVSQEQYLKDAKVCDQLSDDTRAEKVNQKAMGTGYGEHQKAHEKLFGECMEKKGYKRK